MELELTPSHLPGYMASRLEVALSLPIPVASPGPGRTLCEAYTSLGFFAERHANRLGHRLGFGPHAAVRRIQLLISDGAALEQRLQEMRNECYHRLGVVWIAKLKTAGSRLMRYTLPYVLYRVFSANLRSGFEDPNPLVHRWKRSRELLFSQPGILACDASSSLLYGFSSQVIPPRAK